MTDFNQLPYLLDLWDDKSPKVHEGVLQGFASLGRNLYEWLPMLNPVIDNDVVRQIFKELRHDAMIEEIFKSSFHLYHPGQLLEHRRHAYRGVVVDVDYYCMASEQWYFQNSTQPPKLQPWYHVLVHNSDAITYTAESSVLAADIKTPIEHPFVDHFFDYFTNGAYRRNNRPWPRDDGDEV